MENFPSSKKGYESGKADNPQTATQQEAEAARYKQPQDTMDKTIIENLVNEKSLLKKTTTAAKSYPHPREHYSVWTDSESNIYFTKKESDKIDEAASYASETVHQHDNKPYRVILHIEDNSIEETIETYENIKAE